MDPNFYKISNEVYQDLSYLRVLNAVTLEYLVGEVSRSVVGDETSVVFADNMDIVNRISYDLEGEGVEVSNEKLHKILLALRQLVKVFYQVYLK